MARVALVHWKEAEAPERIGRLREAGHRASWHGEDGAVVCRAIAQRRPDAVVIDLGRLPSHGRETAVFLRRRKETRHLPLVLVGGPPEKVARIRELLPDAVYTSWDGIGAALDEAISSRPEAPVVPSSLMASYAGAPLAKKLGIRQGTTVCLVDPPPGFESVIGPLPRGATLRSGDRGNRDLTVCFLRSGRDLRRRLPKIVARAAQGPVWLVWPKKSSGLETDLSFPVVQGAGLAAGLVDSKICAVDETWSGLRFTTRKG